MAEALTPTQVWSCGGGTQSAAIAALIVKGALPKPDLSIIVDTGREKSATWEYADSVLIPSLREVGVELQRVHKSDYATVDFTRTTADGRVYVLLPAFTTYSGSPGKLTNYCSGEWKRDVIMRWMRSQGVKRACNWIGISLDEARRISKPRAKWLTHRYPLIEDVPMSRNACIAAVKAMGWPDPPRSACWMCPNQSQGEWLELRRSHPEDFQKAVELEREVREIDSTITFHPSGVPLDQVDWDSDSLFTAGRETCASGYCFV